MGNIKRVEFTCQGSYSQSYGPDQFYGDGYTCQSGSRVGVWQGDAASFTLNTASQVRCNQIVVTIAEEVVEDLVPPVFNPDGGEFTGSLEVTLSCATENASIFWFYGTEEDQGEHHYYNGPIYLTETNTLTAYSLKGRMAGPHSLPPFPLPTTSPSGPKPLWVMCTVKWSAPPIPNCPITP